MGADIKMYCIEWIKSMLQQRKIFTKLTLLCKYREVVNGWENSSNRFIQPYFSLKQYRFVEATEAFQRHLIYVETAFIQIKNLPGE